MAIIPPSDKPRFNASFVPARSPEPRGTQALTSPEIAVEKAQKDAERRISDVQSQAEQAEHDLRQHLDEIKDEYSRQSEAENVRHENLVQTEKSKGYEQIRELQRAQQKELNRIKREGDREVEVASNYYRDTIDNKLHHGEQELEQIQRTQARQMDYETQVSANDLENAKKQHEMQAQQLKDHHESQMGELSRGAQQEYETSRANYTQATEKAKSEYEARYQAVIAGQNDAMARLQSNTNRELQDLRRIHTEKLAAYDGKASDPFYKLKGIGAEISETKDAYVLTARIPEHERDHLSVTVRGDQVVISGTRKNNDKVELEPGHTQETSSYQSFSESFPLALPVDARKLTRDFQGEELTVVIPKKGTYAPPKPKMAMPERAKVERPDFPENLTAKAELNKQSRASRARASNVEGSDGVPPPRKPWREPLLG